MNLLGKLFFCVSLGGLLSLCLLAGCGVAPTATSPAATPGGATPLGALTGRVHGGQQPLVRAKVYVYAVGTSGYGMASASLLTAGPGTKADGSGHYYVLTDGSGNFSITGDYSCVAGTQVYVYVSGGDPGLGSGDNSAIGLLAGLGECPATRTLALSVPYVTVNEVSTVVTAYALAGFATDGTHISSSGTALADTGVANAMATALNIVNVADGTVPSVSPVGNATLPVANIYTLANILASCVNSAGPGSANCQTLYTNTGTSTDTATAAIAMAHAPFTNVSELFGLASSSPPFEPVLSTAPADLTVSLQYLTPVYEGNLVVPGSVIVYSLAVDSGGNVWTFGSNASFSDSIQTFVKYSPTGNVLATTALPFTTGSDFYARFTQIAIDSMDDVWAGAGPGVYELSSGGALLSPTTGYECTGVQNAIWTVPGVNTVYVGEEFGGDIPELSLAGDCVGSLTPSAQVSFAGPVTVDPQGDVFAAADTAIYKFPLAGTNSSFSASANFVASDGSSDIWTYGVGGGATLEYGDVLAKYSAEGGVLSPSSGYTGGGLVPPVANSGVLDTNGAAPVFDGAGAVWLVSSAAIYNGDTAVPIVGLKSNGTPITPDAGLMSNYSSGYLFSVAADGSGNLWGNPADGSLVEYVGLTTPVATPVIYNHLGQQP